MKLKSKFNIGDIITPINGANLIDKIIDIELEPEQEWVHPYYTVKMIDGDPNIAHRKNSIRQSMYFVDREWKHVYNGLERVLNEVKL